MATIERDREVMRAQGQSPERGIEDPNVNVGEQDVRSEIATRAYELYLQRGAGDGQDMDDWLQAERELRDRSR